MNNKINRELVELLNKELKRQQDHVELIASENYTSPAILQLAGTILTNKYAEGYPHHRYYGGCEYIDEIEILGINWAKKLFNAEHANVQAHSGSQANASAYYAMLEPNDTVLGMDLAAGGHLTHGYKVNFSGRFYNFVSYGVDRETETIDYSALLEQARKVKPKLILAGASAYSREIDFAKLRSICDEVNAYLMVDMAHIAGLIAAGVHSSPIPYADVVTSTTHKTLRGPRGGLILCKKEWAKKIDSAIFPGNQGGPLEHIIAGKAQCFYEALQPEFVKYQKAVVNNAQVLATCFKKANFRLVANGTDNHLLMIDVKQSCQLSGSKAESILQEIGIICNKNMIPFDQEKPVVTSGIRLGTPAMTTRGFGDKEFNELGLIIISVLQDYSPNNLQINKNKVINLLNNFPIYSDLKY